MKCFNCDQELKGREQKKFCSQSCSASFNNRTSPKRTAGYRTCKSCKRQFLKKELARHCFCNECKQQRKDNLLYNRNPSKREMIYEKHNHGAAYAYIRWHARKIILKDDPKICSVCGYSVHAEVAHKKSISDFPDEAKLSDINHKDNLILLCPNHHWEFDHKGLELVGAEGLEPS